MTPPSLGIKAFSCDSALDLQRGRFHRTFQKHEVGTFLRALERTLIRLVLPIVRNGLSTLHDESLEHLTANDIAAAATVAWAGDDCSFAFV
jgi:hypothetical protein